MVKNEILIVDDSEINRSMLRLMLEDDYHITEASNGQEAIAAIEKGNHIFRLILLDLVMPQMDGFQFLEELNRRGWQQQLPVIIISGDNTEESLARAYAHGAADFFAKPFNPNIVHHRVKNVISLYEHSYRDKLTGNYNRSGFIQIAENFLAHEEDVTKYSVMFFDLKNFKAINSLLGTEGGDQVLTRITKIINTCGLDPLFQARLEADHFVCLVETKNIDYEKLQTFNGHTIERNGRQLQIRFRTGAAEIDGRGSIYNFIDRAKISLDYIEDEYLKPYAKFDSQMTDSYINAAVVTSDFENSLANEEFKIYYQPVMDAATGKISSAEALIRWIHPSRGFVRPDLFIPVLEKDGFISKLDLFVDKKVESILRSWKEQGLPVVPVSVNLSWMDFYDSQMINNILDRLRKSHAAPGFVRYEITESSFAALKENRDEVLKEMQQLGSWLLMDDFGSGYSSLGMLMNYKFNVLKIDMSIIRKLEIQPEVEHVVEFIIKMCHKLGMRVVAEGVESQCQVDKLKNAQCDYIQGYYFSKPLPEAEFKEFLAKCKAEGKIVEY